MKNKTRILSAGLVLLSNLSPQLSTCFAQPTAFTYQGRLSEGSNPANGIYDLRFSLCDDPSGGNNYGFPVTNNTVVVSNGLLTTTLDFGQGPFNGTPLWLQIAARTNGTGAFAFLSPRQALTPSPYALRAANAGTVFASGIFGTIGDASLSPNIARLNGANQVFTGLVTLSNTANVFSGDGAGLANVNAARLGGLSSSGFWKAAGNGGTTAGAHFLGTTDNQPLELRVNGQRALRLQPDPRGQEAPNLIGGFHGNSISSNAAGSSVIAGGGYAGGPNFIQDNSSGDFIGAGSANLIQSNVNDSVIAGGYGNTIGAANAVIGGGRDNLVLGEHAAILGGRAQTNAALGGMIGGGIGNTITGAGVDGVIAGGAGNHVSARGASIPGGYANSADAEASLAAGYRAKANHAGTFLWADITDADFASTGNNQFLVRASGGVGINTADTAAGTMTVAGTMKIEGDSSHTKPSLELHETQDGDYARIQLQVANRPLWHISVGGADNSLVFYNSTNSIVSSISEAGVFTTRVLTITGGADIAEPFAMSGRNLPKGAVVVIDEENPGRLKLSAEPYDRRVAGIISGAGGVNTGLSLSQHGVMEGDQPVALTGRVYVQADTANGPVKPGDLLTTSVTPGHAMRVTDHARAQGATLGKAMTGLAEGRGLVLVLVTLQ